MRRKPRITVLLALVCCLALVAAACGGGERAATTTEKQRSETTSPMIGGQPDRGGIMRFASTEGPDYMDPGAAYTVTFFSFVAPGVFRTLTSYKRHTQDLAEQSQVTPDLATDLGQSNADNTEWTYTLKDGIKFGPALGGQNIPGVTGQEVTSADVKYAVERLFLGSVAGGYPFYYEPIEGVKEFQSGKADEISGIETPDDKTIVFNLSRPVGDWDYRMAMPATTPVPEKYASKFDQEKTSNYDQHVVATGPYYVKEYVPSDRMTMRRNPQWDPATDDLREAYVDGVDWKMGFDQEVCVEKVLNNDYDTAVDCDVEGAQLKDVVQTPEFSDRFFNLPIACTSYIFLNTTVEPFDDPKVREAINLAVNKQQQLKLVGGSYAGDMATSILPPGMVGHLPTSEYDPFKTKNYAGDEKKAKELLAEAGLEDGFDGKLLLVGDAQGAGVRQMESLRSDLEGIGFTNLEIKQLNYPDYYTQYYEVPRTNTAMGFAAWCEDYPSPVTFLEPLLYGPNILPQGNSNYSELDDPQVNEDIESATEVPLNEADDEWAQANRAATEAAPWVPLRWYLDDELASTGVEGAYWHSYYTALDWVNVGVK